jgi:hypothetical protein
LDILIIAFNRPELLAKTLKNIQSLQGVSRVFFSLDGPRNNEDQEKINRCLSEIKLFSAQATQETKIIQRDENKGVKLNVINSIDWVFEHSNSAIIVEDDVIISQTFVDWIRYKNNPLPDDCAAICAFQESNYGGHFYRSPFFRPWGWYTDKKNWEEFRCANHPYKDILVGKSSRLFGFDFSKKLFWANLYFQSYHRFNKLGTWDWAYCCSNWSRGKKYLVPGISLSQNIGIGLDSTHSSGASYKSLINPNLGQEMKDQIEELSLSDREHERKRFYQEVGFKFSLLPRYLFGTLRGVLSK